MAINISKNDSAVKHKMIVPPIKFQILSKILNSGMNFRFSQFKALLPRNGTKLALKNFSDNGN